jgi:thiol-disulfide isomerase/thioredoxin
MAVMLRGLSLIVLIGLASAAGFFGYRQWQSHQLPGGALAVASVAPAQSSAAATSAAQPPDAATTPPPAVPDTVPDLKLPDPKGEPKSLRDYLGRPLIINFWATWCGPCRREIPLLEQLRQTYKGERLEVVGIAVDFQAAVAEYLQKTPIAYPLMVGEDQGLAAAEQFGVEPVLPFSVFADAQGRIIAVKVGELHQNEADYILSTMRQVASGKKSLADARAAIADKLRTFAIERAKAGTSES